MPQEVDVYDKLLADHLGLGIETETDFKNALSDWLTTQTRFREIFDSVRSQRLQNGLNDFSAYFKETSFSGLSA